MYIEVFNNNQDIIDKYQAPANALDGANVLLAWYGYGDYCGSSLVIYEKDGQLYEVNGGHCSCNGLEGQWEPEETSWQSLSMRNLKGEYGGSVEAHNELQRLVKEHLN